MSTVFDDLRLSHEQHRLAGTDAQPQVIVLAGRQAVIEAAVFGREFVLTVAPKELQRTSALVLSCIPLPALLAPLLGRLGPPPWLLPGRGGGRDAIRLR